MTQAELLERLPSILPAGALRSSDVVRGQAVADLERTLMRDALAALRDHPDVRLEMLSDLTAVDYLGRVPRFEVVYQLYSIARNHRLRVKVAVPEEDPVVSSVSSLWKSAIWAERNIGSRAIASFFASAAVGVTFAVVSGGVATLAVVAIVAAVAASLRHYDAGEHLPAQAPPLRSPM